MQNATELNWVNYCINLQIVKIATCSLWQDFRVISIVHEL